MVDPEKLAYAAHLRETGHSVAEIVLTDFTDAQAVATVARITRGNFRLVIGDA